MRKNIKVWHCCVEPATVSNCVVLQTGKKKPNRAKTVLTNSPFESPLGKEYLKSEIEKNKSIVDLNKLRMEVLKKILLREEEKSNIDIFDHVTYL